MEEVDDEDDADDEEDAEVEVEEEAADEDDAVGDPAWKTIPSLVATDPALVAVP